MSFLGIDLGTGGVRCLLVSESGEILEDISRSLSQINLSDVAGHSEQDANEWISILAKLYSMACFFTFQRTGGALPCKAPSPPSLSSLYTQTNGGTARSRADALHARPTPVLRWSFLDVLL